MLKISNPFFKTRNLYLFCLMVIAVGLSLSKPMVSMGQIGLFLIWVFDENIKQKFLNYYKNKTAVILSALYLVTIFGLLYTSNFNYAIGDVRRKMPIFFLPFYIAGFKAITNKEFLLLFKIYLAGVITSSFWSIFVMLGGLNINIVDQRSLSRFNSHIRFGLEICFAIFGAIYYMVKEERLNAKILWIGLISWLIAFLFIINLFTGIVVFALTTVILLLVYAIKIKNKKIKIAFGIVFISFLFGGYYYLKTSVNNYYQADNITKLKPLKTTDDGETYKSKTGKLAELKENGFYIYRNIAWHELENTWNKRSKILFTATDLKGQKLKHTLIRFITSQGKRKNKQAVMELSNKQIAAIEKGIANCKYLTMNEISIRFHKIIWEYDRYIHGEDINGHSVIMRWVYWKTAFHIFKKNLLFGVGTGDLQDAFNHQYTLDKTKLSEKYHLRAHNQYITYAVSFGVLGLLIFLLTLFYPFFKTKMFNNYLYLSFFIIILLSMVTEDTLETQIGITFFAYFNTLLLLKEKTKPFI